MSVAIIAKETGPVHARPPSNIVMDLSHMLDAQIIATHSFATAPPLDLLIVAGGLGFNTLVANNDTTVEDFVAACFDATDYVVSVCTGAAFLARAGVLEGRNATTNKAAWADVTKFGENVNWVPNARWVQDGKVWTSSGVSAGMDMMTAFLRHIYGDPKVNHAVNVIEYAPHTNPTWDAFAVVHNVPGADVNRSLTDCVTPLREYPSMMG